MKTLLVNECIDEEDLLLISQYSWHVQVTAGGKKYWQTGNTSGRILMHHLIMGGKGIDHLDGNGLNNHRSNLRFATHSQNMQNRKGWGKTKYKGVYLQKPGAAKPYQAQFWNGIANKSLGYFATEEEAARRWDEECKKIRGKFAVLNFPGGK